MAEPTERSLPLLWRLLKEAGNPEELARWARDYPAPKRGAPRNDTLDVLLDMIEGYHGPDWIMRTRKGKLVKSRHSILRYYVEELVRDHTKRSRDRALPENLRQAWDPKHLGRSSRSAKRRSDYDLTKRQIDSITRRLTSELRKRAKARKTAV
jgi:hypothetical protein